MPDISFIDKRIKESLHRELKDNYTRYIKLLQRWFQQQLNKEEFDKLARSLFPNSDVSTHNRFILSIMSSCQIVEAPSMANQTRVSKNFRHRFKEVPQMPLISLISEYQMSHGNQSAFDHGRKDFSVATTSCIREQSLPGSWMLYGRLMNTLQLYALQEFAPEALNCLAEAAHLLARRVLLSALASRRCCRLVPASSRCLASAGAERLQQQQQQQPSEIHQSSSLAESPTTSSGALLPPPPPPPPLPRFRRSLERVAFGRFPIARLSLGEGFVAAVRGERLNAHLHCAATPVVAASTAAEDPAEAAERLRVDALLRCDPEAVARAGNAALATTTIGVADFYRVVTQPDSHLVGYHCLQRRDQAVASHFVRFLSQSRAFHRLRRRQLREANDLDCDWESNPVLPVTSTAAVAVAPSAITSSDGSLRFSAGAKTGAAFQTPGAVVPQIGNSCHLERLLLLDGEEDRMLMEFRSTFDKY